MLGTAGFGGIRNDGAVQGILNDHIAQRVLHFCDLQGSQRELIHTCRGYKQRTVGIAGGQIILTVNTPAVGIRGKKPGSGSCSRPVVIGIELPLEYRPGKGAVALSSGGVLVHLGQNKGRVEHRHIGHGDHIIAGGNGVGVGLCVQLVACGGFCFLDGQHGTYSVLLRGSRIAIGICLEGFHHLTVYGHGILRTGEAVQRVALDLIDTSLGCVDGFL